MLAISFFYRDPSFLYTLESHPPYWFHVGIGESTQVIMGLLGNKICEIVFDEKGDLIEILEKPLVVRSFSQCSDEFDVLYRSIEAEVGEIRKKRRLIDKAIHVKRFRFPLLLAGIDDVPEDLLEYIAKRDTLIPREDDLEEAIEGWYGEESLFVFWWEQSFYVNGQGTVETS